MGGVQAYLLIGKLFWSDLIEKTNFITHTIYYDVYTICKLFNTICVAF